MIAHENVVISMMDGYSDVESVLRSLQSKAEYENHSYSCDFRISTLLCGIGNMLYMLKTPSSWVYIPELHGTERPKRCNTDYEFTIQDIWCVAIAA